MCIHTLEGGGRPTGLDVISHILSRLHVPYELAFASDVFGLDWGRRWRDNVRRIYVICFRRLPSDFPRLSSASIGCPSSDVGAHRFPPTYVNVFHSFRRHASLSEQSKVSLTLSLLCMYLYAHAVAEQVGQVAKRPLFSLCCSLALSLSLSRALAHCLSLWLSLSLFLSLSLSRLHCPCHPKGPAKKVILQTFGPTIFFDNVFRRDEKTMPSVLPPSPLCSHRPKPLLHKRHS